MQTIKRNELNKNHTPKSSLKRQGKSGGARVITNVWIAGTTIYLLSIYDKSEIANISDKDLLERLKNIGRK